MSEKEFSVTRVAFIMYRFQDIFGRLKKCTRWGGYRTKHYEQSSLEHSFSLALLTAFCVKKEKELSGLELDEARLIVRALLHDFCEGAIGDITFRFKNDPRIKYLLGLIEKEEGLRQMNVFEIIGSFLSDAYILPEGSILEGFFDAMEKLDYVLYALAEHQIHNNHEFVAVLYRQHDKLVEYARQFRSVALFYTPEMQKYVKEQIELHPYAISDQKVHEATEKDIDDVKEALRLLLMKQAV